MSFPLTEDRLRSEGLGAYFRPRDLERIGIPFQELQAHVRSGEVERVGRGLYRLMSAEYHGHETLAMVAAAVPESVLCLLTALSFHEIGTQMPRQVWIALAGKARKPTSVPVDLRIVRFSDTMLRYGVHEHRILGVRVRITSPARTVADCFRYRNKIGLDVALEALRDALRSRIATVDQLVRTGEACGVDRVMRPYMEGLLS